MEARTKLTKNGLMKKEENEEEEDVGIGKAREDFNVAVERMQRALAKLDGLMLHAPIDCHGEKTERAAFADGHNTVAELLRVGENLRRAESERRIMARFLATQRVLREIEAGISVDERKTHVMALLQTISNAKNSSPVGLSARKIFCQCLLEQGVMHLECNGENPQVPLVLFSAAAIESEMRRRKCTPEGVAQIKLLILSISICLRVILRGVYDEDEFDRCATRDEAAKFFVEFEHILSATPAERLTYRSIKNHMKMVVGANDFQKNKRVVKDVLLRLNCARAHLKHTVSLGVLRELGIVKEFFSFSYTEEMVADGEERKRAISICDALTEACRVVFLVKELRSRLSKPVCEAVTVVSQTVESLVIRYFEGYLQQTSMADNASYSYTDINAMAAQSCSQALAELMGGGSSHLLASKFAESISAPLVEKTAMYITEAMGSGEDVTMLFRHLCDSCQLMQSLLKEGTVIIDTIIGRGNIATACSEALASKLVGATRSVVMQLLTTAKRRKRARAGDMYLRQISRALNVMWNVVDSMREEGHAAMAQRTARHIISVLRDDTQDFAKKCSDAMRARMVALTIVIDIVQYAVGSSGRETGGLNAGQKKRSIKKRRIGCCIFATRQAGDMQSQLSPIYCDWLESAFLFYLEMNRSVSGFAGPDSEDSSSLTDTPYAKCVEQLWTTFIGIVDSSMLKCIVDSNKAREKFAALAAKVPYDIAKKAKLFEEETGCIRGIISSASAARDIVLCASRCYEQGLQKDFQKLSLHPNFVSRKEREFEKWREEKARLVGHLHEDWLKRCRLHASEIYRQLRLDSDYSLREKDDDNRAARSPPSEPTSACSEVCKFWLARANDAVYYLRGGNARRTVEFIREEMLAGILYDILSRCRICTAGALRLQRDLAEYRHTDDAIVSAAKTATTLSWNKSVEALSKPLLFSLEQLTHICGLFAADGEDLAKMVQGNQILTCMERSVIDKFLVRRADFKSP